MDTLEAKGQERCLPEMVRGMEHHEDRLGELGSFSLQKRRLCRDTIAPSSARREPTGKMGRDFLQGPGVTGEMASTLKRVGLGQTLGRNS